MYNPKDVLTENGLEAYNAHLYNICVGLFYLKNHMDDLHIGAINEELENKLCNVINNFEEILPTLKTGDGEKDE